MLTSQEKKLIINKILDKPIFKIWQQLEEAQGNRESWVRHYSQEFNEPIIPLFTIQEKS